MYFSLSLHILVVLGVTSDVYIFLDSFLVFFIAGIWPCGAIHHFIKATFLSQYHIIRSDCHSNREQDNGACLATVQLIWELLGTVVCEQQIIVSGVFFFLLSESRIQDVDNDWVGFICIPSFRVLAEHDCFFTSVGSKLKILEWIYIWEPNLCWFSTSRLLV